MKRPVVRPSLPRPPAAVPLPGLSDARSLGPLKPPAGLLSRAWQWLRTRQMRRVDAGRLQVAETVSLGEKRFVAVVQVDGRHFLLAGGPANIALLAQLDDKEPFANVLEKTMTVAEKPAPREKPRKAAVVHAPSPPAPHKTWPAPRKQTARASANKAANALPASQSPLAAESTFAKLLSTAITKAGKPSAKETHQRSAPATLHPRQLPRGPRRDDKIIAAPKKAAPKAAPAKVNDEPVDRPAGESFEQTFEQWLLQAALRQQASKKSAPQADRHPAVKSAYSPPIPKGSKPAPAWRKESATSLDPPSDLSSDSLPDPLSGKRPSAVPPPPRSSAITIEEYA